MTEAEFKEWVKANGTLWETSTGCWIRCYFDDFWLKYQADILAAEKRGERRGRRGKK